MGKALNDEARELVTYVIFGVITTICGFLFMLYRSKHKGEADQSKSYDVAKRHISHEDSAKTKKKGPKPRARKESDHKTKDAAYNHEWLLTTLKGHSGIVSNLSYSIDNQYLASVADDRTMFLWLTKNFSTSDHKHYRLNIEFDYANKVSFSPDSKAVLISKADQLELEVYKIEKKADGSGVNIQSALKWDSAHKTRIVGLGIACNGKYMMTCSSDGRLVIWTLKATIIEELKVGDGLTILAKISPCGRYVGVCGKYSSGIDLLVYSVDYQQKNVSIHVKIPTQKQGCYGFDFNTDSSKLAAIGMDFVWRLYDITGNRVTQDCSGSIDKVSVGEDAYPVVKVSGDGRIVVVASSGELSFFSTPMAGLFLGKVDGMHGNESVRDVVFSEGDKYFSTCGDKYIRVFHNVPGLQETRRHMLHLIDLKSTSPALRNRLKTELVAVEESLRNFKL